MNKQKRLLNAEGGGVGTGHEDVYREPTTLKYFYPETIVDKAGIEP
jgi:hypothetical protein